MVYWKCDHKILNFLCVEVRGGIKIKKKLYGIVLSGAMLLTVGFISAVPAFANNSGNTSYSFSFPIGTTTKYTSTRPKYDNSSSYMKLTDIGGTGTHPGYMASVVNQYGDNFSKEWYYNFDKDNLNQGVWMYNYAFEDNPGANYVYVKIKATRGDQNSFYADGVWSPDSVGGP